MEDKEKRMLALAEKRRLDPLDKLSKPYLQVEEIDDGNWEGCKLVSPRSKSSFNLNSDLMIIMQDWASHDPNPSQVRINKSNDCDSREFLFKNGYHPKTKTNTNLQVLLHDTFRLEFKDVYITNLFVFIKIGKMNERIPRCDLNYSASTYTLNEIDIVNPKLIICLGEATYLTLTKLITSESVKFRESLSNPINYRGSVIYGVPHTSPLGIANCGGFLEAKNIWNEVFHRYVNLDKSSRNLNASFE